MSFGTNIIQQKVLNVQIKYGGCPRILYEMLSVPQNIVMDQNNVMCLRS